MKKNILVALGFLILIIAATFPLVFKIATHIPGFFSSDELYFVLWNAWFIKLSLLHNLSIMSTNLIAYPFGVNFYSSQPFCYLFFFINFALSFLTNPILTYNLQIIFNYFLTALFTYFLVYHLTRNRCAGFLSGTIFGFCPYIFVRSWQHLGETYLWMMPLVLWFLFRIKEENTKKIKLLFIISLILTTINFGVVYYTTIILITFCLYLIIYNWKNRAILPKESLKSDILYLKGILLLSIVALFFLLPQFYPIIKNTIFSYHSKASAFNLYHRPFEDLFIQSAKPLSYFLPAVVHPVFGKFTEMFIGSPLYGMSFTEHTLYLGWVPVILAFLAFRAKRRHHRYQSVCSPQTGRDDNFYISFFTLLAIVAWFFSQPPWWRFGSFKIFMPSYFMYKIIPMFRAYCRFGAVVMLAVAVLAGFGFKFILERFKLRKARLAITILFCALVLFEFWSYPPLKVIDVSRVPAVYYWLRNQPGDLAVAEYPLDTEGANPMYILYQTEHQKKMINATTPGTYPNRVSKSISKLSEPNTAGVLKWMSVKYVLVHRDDYKNTGLTEWVEELNKIPQNPGLKFIKSFPVQECQQKDIMCVQQTGPIDVYELTVLPVKPEIE